MMKMMVLGLPSSEVLATVLALFHALTQKNKKEMQIVEVI